MVTQCDAYLQLRYEINTGIQKAVYCQALDRTAKGENQIIEIIVHRQYTSILFVTGVKQEVSI